MKRTINIQFVILPLIVNALLFQQGIAQYKGLNQEPLKKDRKLTTPPPKYIPTPMTQAVSIPGLPSYPGKPVFDGGDAYNKDPNGTRYIMHLETKDKPIIVFNWYMNVLNPPQWKVLTSKNGLVSAVDQNGGHVTIHVRQFGKKTRINIYYTPPITKPG